MEKNIPETWKTGCFLAFFFLLDHTRFLENVTRFFNRTYEILGKKRENFSTQKKWREWKSIPDFMENPRENPVYFFEKKNDFCREFSAFFFSIFEKIRAWKCPVKKKASLIYGKIFKNGYCPHRFFSVRAEREKSGARVPPNFPIFRKKFQCAARIESRAFLAKNTVNSRLK